MEMEQIPLPMGISTLGSTLRENSMEKDVLFGKMG